MPKEFTKCKFVKATAGPDFGLSLSASLSTMTMS